MSEIIRLHGSIVEALFRSEYEDHDIEDDLEEDNPYKGWFVYADKDTGSYDSGKSAMVDFEIDLYNAKEEYMGTAIGGYYIQGDYSFDFGSDHFYEFEQVEETPDSKFNNFLIELAEEEGLSIKQKITKINNYKY